MKLPDGNTRIFVIAGGVIALCVLLYVMASGIAVQSGDQKDQGTITGNTTPAIPLTIDTSFEIQEANVSIVRSINSTHVTYEDLQIYPELEEYLHGVNTDPAPWYNGWRYIASFEGNMSRYDMLVREICNGKTIFECSHGTLIEYHDHYYRISYLEYSVQRNRNPVSICSPQEATPRILVPVDTSVPIQDPVPGIRDSLNQNDSGRTIELAKGDIVEINLRWIPGLGFRWFIPVSGCGIELVNDGYYDTGTDFWNTSGHYRARYRAVSPGRSFLDGKFVISPKDDPTADFQFNLTVIVK